MGDSKAPGRSLSESTGLRPHAASVKIDRPIFALASGLKQLAKVRWPSSALFPLPVFSPLPVSSCSFQLPAYRFFPLTVFFPLPASRYQLPAPSFPLPASRYIPASRYPLPATSFPLPPSSFPLHLLLDAHAALHASTFEL